MTEHVLALLLVGLGTIGLRTSQVAASLAVRVVGIRRAAWSINARGTDTRAGPASRPGSSSLLACSVCSAYHLDQRRTRQWVHDLI